MQLSLSADLDEAGDPVVSSFKLHQKEEPVDEGALISGKIGVTDAWRLATSAEGVDGIIMDREIAREYALTKLRAELIVLGDDAFKSGLLISVDVVLTLFAKIMRPTGQKLLDFTLLVNDKSDNKTVLWTHALDLLRVDSKMH